MECIAIAMQDGGAGRVRGMRRRHEPRGQPHFVLPPNLYNWPPGRGTFWFQIFIQASSPEIWRKTIFGGEGGCWRGKWGGLFWATSFGKKFAGGEDIAAARFGTEKAQEPLQRVNRAGTHLLGLINQVLDLSKIEAGKLELNPQIVQLAPLINEVIGTAGQLA